MYYFSSDLHFGSQEDLLIDNRPFKNTKQFKKFVIKTWNKQTNKNDTIFIIGDIIDCDSPDNHSWKENLSVVKKFKAKVVLIVGNNEERVIKYFFNNDFDKFKKYCLDLGFKDVHKNLVLEFAGQKFYLVHKPKNYNPNYINLFGHMHRAGGIWKPFGFNIGCDINHFRLHSENDISFLLYLKPKYWDNDENLKTF